jgi:hypothetical protein
MNTAEQPSLRAMVAEIVPLAGAIAGEGPPVVLLLAPWLLLGLVLSGPFAFLLTLVVAMLAAAAVLVALAAAIVAPPYLLVRSIRRYRAHRALSEGRAARPAPIVAPRVAA